ncbi:DUF4432 family protein [Paracoccus sediminicola]|uniref:DUF4432 family protein n=1 Tax=Paracoccus sediminicola TaxID=3017783 RepID=UPI0022F005DC|nr:DUF4432 family protein [Paracoccus sediminicola]WBU56322.1 DUF4432 family protein [Paracoccus sediminicola]
MIATIPLHPDQFTAAPRELARFGGLDAIAFRYATGVAALRLANARGMVEILPFMGQIIWHGEFDGVRLGMESQFDSPREADSIIGTYGCLGFHSGLLANGVPTARDDHPVHGEFPVCAMDEAWLEVGSDNNGAFIRLCGARSYIAGFGPHYRATPSVTLHETGSMIGWTMRVENRSSFPMPLQYMAHLNPAFVEGAEICQPAPFTPDRTQVRQAVPAHVTPNPDYLALIDRLAQDPSAMRRLGQPEYDPEQVFYIREPAMDADGIAHLMLRRPEGDGIAVAYRPAQFPKLVRWILANGDTRVAAFALPSTCEPEGRAAELEKGNVIELAPGATAEFGLSFGYVDTQEAEALASAIAKIGG